MENLELIHAINTSARQKALVQLLDKPIDPRVVLFGGTLDNFADRMASVPTTDLSNVCPINLRW